MGGLKGRAAAGAVDSKSDWMPFIWTTVFAFLLTPVFGSLAMWLHLMPTLPPQAIGTAIPEQNVKSGTQCIQKRDFYMPEILVTDTADKKRTMNFATQVSDAPESEMFDFPMGTN